MALTDQMRMVLKAEIIGDPVARGYAGKTADEQADLVNAGFDVQSPPMTVDVPVGSVEGYLRSRLLFGALSKFVTSPPQGAPAELVEGLGELMGMVLSPHVATVQMTDPVVNGAVTAVLGAAVTAGLIAAQNRDDLMAMASPMPAPTEHHARVVDVFMGIAEAPNAVTADDVTGALAS